MSLPRSVPWVAAALMASAACSHNEELKQTPKVVAAAPRTAPPPAAKPQAPVAEEAPQAKADDAIYFDFDSAVLRNEAHPVLQRVADSVQRRPKSLRIEGNCDETGTVEYNLALGDHRARAAKEYLVHLGIPANRIATVTYGSQRPKDPGHDESAHSRNRRDDILVQ
ncbi:MAG TPA: OmpA family protein [Polyangia bacterium]|nr:OmpA family protein [Polyangia bacterium]